MLATFSSNFNTYVRTFFIILLDDYYKYGYGDALFSEHSRTEFGLVRVVIDIDIDRSLSK